MRYMGAREWARAHKPSVILGVYADDELENIANRDVPAGQRAVRMKDITPKQVVADDLPDIPAVASVADKEPSQTDDARKAITEAISLEMLEHIRETFDGANWDELGDAFDAKYDELKARAV